MITHSIFRKAIGQILLTVMLFLSAAMAMAQEGIISSVYMAERTALQKMQAARKAGNEDEVKRLSAEITEMVNQKKSWARGLLTLTESSIKKAQNDNAPELSTEQRAALISKLESLHAKMRILDLELDENKWAYFTEKHKIHDYLKSWEDQLQAIYDYAAKEIARNEEEIAKAEQDLKKLIEAHEKEFETKNKNAEEQVKLLAEARKKLAEGKASADNVKSAEQGVEYFRKDMADTRQKMDEGTYKSRFDNWTSANSYRTIVKSRQDKITGINAALADESMMHRHAGRLGHPTIKACKQIIEKNRAEIEKQRALYTAEEWGKRKELRQSRQNLNIEILKLQEKVGLKDEKIDALIARRNELEKFIYHDFLTEIPKEDSGFIKAIKWISNTLDKVNEVAEKFKRLKTLVDLVKGSSNPINAINFVLKEATGIDLTQRLAEKLLPDEVLENPLVQRLIKGEHVNRQDILKEAIVKDLSTELKNKVEQTIDLINTARSGNIRDLIAQHGFERAMRVIDSQPELKKAWETFNQANKIMKNPELLEDRLESSIRERVILELKASGSEVVDSLVSEETRKRIAVYEEKLKKMKDDFSNKSNLAADYVAISALTTIKQGYENLVDMPDKDPNSEKHSAEENLVSNYQVTK